MSKNTTHPNSLNNDKICEYCGKKLLWKGSYTRRQYFCPNAPHRSIKHLPKFGYKYTKFTLQYSVKLLFVGLIFLNFGLVVTLMLLYSIYKSIMVYSGNLKDQDWMVSGDRFPTSSARTLRNLMAIIVLFPIIALVAFFSQ